MATLPNELWIDIFERLDRADLPSISGVSKIFHALVEPALHSVLDTAKYNGSHSSKKVQTKYESFLKRLAQAPWLVKYFKHVVVTAGEVGELDPSIFSTPWMHAQVSSAKKIKLGAKWHIQCHQLTGQRMRFDAIVAFLVHLFSASLETLTIYDYSRRPGSLATIDAVLSQVDFKSVPLLILPGISDFPGGDDYYSAKHVELTHCLMRQDDLARFLGSFLDLKTLKLEISHQTLFRFRLPIINQTPKLGETLEELTTYNNDNNDYVRHFHCHPNGKLRRLRTRHWTDCQALKLLTLDVCSALGPGDRDELVYSNAVVEDFSKSLPSSLQALVLKNCELGMLGHISTILFHNSKSLPKLVELKLEFRVLDVLERDERFDRDAAHRAMFKTTAFSTANKYGVKLVLLNAE